MNKPIGYFSLLTWLMPLLMVLPAQAITINELLNENKLSVEIRLKTTGTIIARQPVVFEIEVATKRWFAKGTRIVNPTVAGAVMLPAGGFGVNGTKKIKGVTWASQTREIILYPSHEGLYRLPPIEIEVSVNSQNHGVVQGAVYTQVIDFVVATPAKLRQYKNYIVSPEVQLIIDQQGLDKQSFAVGEAISQTITFIAVDVPAMMLPPLTKPELAGLSIYHKPAQLNDKSSRGLRTGIRTEAFSYIFEQAGEYHLPEQKFYWWNMATQQLSELIIPAKTWRVSGITKQKNQIGITEYQKFPSLQQLIFLLLLLSILLGVYGCYHYRTRLFCYFSKLINLHYRRQCRDFIQAIEQAEYQLACKILYQITDRSNNTPSSLKDCYCNHPSKLVVLEKLLSKAYGIENNGIELDINEAKILLEQSSRDAKPSARDLLNENLQLNPKK